MFGTIMFRPKRVYIMKLGFTLIAAATILSASAAQADIYTFTFTGGSYTVSDGSFTTTGPVNADGTYDITSAAGTLVSADLSLPQGTFTLTPGNGASLATADGQELYSNLYTPGATSFAAQGLEVEGAGFELNLYNAVNAAYAKCKGVDCASVPGGSLFDPGDTGVISITAVPEPAMWTLMIVGFAMTGFAARRRSAAIAA